MSRVGRLPVQIPDKVKVAANGRALAVEGPLGKLDMLMPEGVSIKIDNNVAEVQSADSSRQARAFQGLVRASLANMVEGVTKGYEKTLEIQGVGYKADLKGTTLTLMVGYSHNVVFELPSGIKAEIDKSATKVTVKGIDKQLVGRFAAQIRASKKPEPYKGKGVRYLGEQIIRKVGKAGAK